MLHSGALLFSSSALFKFPDSACLLCWDSSSRSSVSILWFQALEKKLYFHFHLNWQIFTRDSYQLTCINLFFPTHLFLLSGPIKGLYSCRTWHISSVLEPSYEVSCGGEEMFSQLALLLSKKKQQKQQQQQRWTLTRQTRLHLHLHLCREPETLSLWPFFLSPPSSSR